MTGDTGTGAKAEMVARSPMSRIVRADRSAEVPLSARIFRAEDANRIGLLADPDAVLEPEASPLGIRGPAHSSQSASTSSVCAPGAAGGPEIAPGVRENLGAGAGCTTPSQSTKTPRSTR
jgi:hypothetical protein